MPCFELNALMLWLSCQLAMLADHCMPCMRDGYALDCHACRSLYAMYARGLRIELPCLLIIVCHVYVRVTLEVVMLALMTL